MPVALSADGENIGHIDIVYRSRPNTAGAAKMKFYGAPAN